MKLRFLIELVSLKGFLKPAASQPFIGLPHSLWSLADCSLSPAKISLSKWKSEKTERKIECQTSRSEHWAGFDSSKSNLFNPCDQCTQINITKQAKSLSLKTWRRAEWLIGQLKQPTRSVAESLRGTLGRHCEVQDTSLKRVSGSSSENRFNACIASDTTRDLAAVHCLLQSSSTRAGCRSLASLQRSDFKGRKLVENLNSGSVTQRTLFHSENPQRDFLASKIDQK